MIDPDPWDPMNQVPPTFEEVIVLIASLVWLPIVGTLYYLGVL